MKRRRQHAPGAEGCGGHAKHCYACDRDEDGTCYLACLECGHLYRSRLELRWRYLASFWQYPAERCFWWRWWPVWWRRLTLPAGNITYCPLCSADF